MADLDREAELRRLFDRALDLGPGERGAMVAGVADELLRERLLALLQQDAGSTVVALQRPLVGTGGALRRVGNYELLRPLGSGGMGIVVLARQVEPIERLVAIKFVGDPSTGGELLQRFRAEQQALGRMNHPGIARVLEGGADEQDGPYFVMEYVRGLPITDHCDKRRLSLDERIRLAIQVCDAVQHAHQRGVIHRDLKPGNLLVGEESGRPQPKVIDFGVARAVAGRLATMAPTGDGRAIGTLRYMSPEQAAVEPDLDTRTDIYSLGVVLFELLVGQPPLSLTSDPGSLLRFREDLAAGRLPTAARAAAALDPATAAQRAEQRSTTVAAWRRALAGDVGAIVGRALELDRSRRYPSASELAADLHRYLAHESVSARAPTFGYLAARFVQRNRRAVFAASLALSCIVGGGLAAAFGMLAATTARDEEAAARRRLAAAVERQQAVDEFDEFVLLYGDPGLSGSAPSLRQALDAAIPILDARWRGAPQQQAAVRAALGRRLLRLGEPELAKLHLQQAWAAIDGIQADDPAWSMSVLAELRRAEQQSGDLASSQRHLVRLLELGAVAVGASSPELAALLLELAREVSPPPERAAAFVARWDRAFSLLSAGPAGDRSLLLVGEFLFAVAFGAYQDGLPGSDALLLRLEGFARQAFGDDVEFAMVLASLAENRWSLGDGREALQFANDLLAVLARLDLSRHWLAAKAARLRGLALVATGEAAKGEAELLALRERLLIHRATGNAQVRSAIDAPLELARWLLDRGKLEEHLQASFARWAATEPSPPPAPWWPSMLDENAPPRVFETALAVVDASAAGTLPVPRGAQRAMLLLRLGRFDSALPLLAAAVAGLPVPVPELLADLVVLRRRTGDESGAEGALADLGRSAAAARGGGLEGRWALAVERASVARR